MASPTPDLSTVEIDPDAAAEHLDEEHHVTHKLGTVFWTSVGVSAIFVAWSVLFTENLSKVTTASLNWVTGSFGWLYLVVTLGILVFLAFLACSPVGKLRLGKDTDRLSSAPSPGWR